jgi:hypothetical protein
MRGVDGNRLTGLKVQTITFSMRVCGGIYALTLQGRQAGAVAEIFGRMIGITDPCARVTGLPGSDTLRRSLASVSQPNGDAARWRAL